MHFIVATYIDASSQVRHTHSARTKNASILGNGAQYHSYSWHIYMNNRYDLVSLTPCYSNWEWLFWVWLLFGSASSKSINKFPLTSMGVLAHPLCKLDCSLVPPSAWVEIFCRLCLQSHLNISILATTPLTEDNVFSYVCKPKGIV